jgi:hypothetical protein
MQATSGTFIGFPIIGVPAGFSWLVSDFPVTPFGGTDSAEPAVCLLDPEPQASIDPDSEIGTTKLTK